MIRKATFADVDSIVELGAWIFESTPYRRNFEFDPYEAKLAIARALGDRENGLVLVSERRGEVEGFVVAGTFQLPFSSTSYVSDLALVSRDGSGGWLFRRMLKWARDRGLPVLASSGGQLKSAALYLRAGMSPAGTLFVG